MAYVQAALVKHGPHSSTAQIRRTSRTCWQPAGASSLEHMHLLPVQRFPHTEPYTAQALGPPSRDQQQCTALGTLFAIAAWGLRADWTVSHSCRATSARRVTIPLLISLALASAASPPTSRTYRGPVGRIGLDHLFNEHLTPVHQLLLVPYLARVGAHTVLVIPAAVQIGQGSA